MSVIEDIGTNNPRYIMLKLVAKTPNVSIVFFSRFIGIFRFIYDHVFGPFPQRAYADPPEKWQLVISCLKHFQM